MAECQQGTPCCSIHAAGAGIHTMQMITKVNYWGMRIDCIRSFGYSKPGEQEQETTILPPACVPYQKPRMTTRKCAQPCSARKKTQQSLMSHWNLLATCRTLSWGWLWDSSCLTFFLLPPLKALTLLLLLRGWTSRRISKSLQTIHIALKNS